VSQGLASSLVTLSPGCDAWAWSWIWRASCETCEAAGPIVVRSVELDRPVLALKVLEDGSANWDITKPAPATPDQKASRPLAVSLRRLDIGDARISLDDLKSKLFASVIGFRQSLSGDFGRRRSCSRRPRTPTR
jgi:hypothetical protein